MSDHPPGSDRPARVWRFDRSSWFTLALALALAAASAWVYRAAFRLPVDGWYTDIGAFGRYEAPIFLEDAGGQNPGLQPGDVLLAVEGIPFEQLEEAAARLTLQLPENWQLGEQVRYTVLRQGKLVDVLVTLGPQPPPLGLYNLNSLLTDPVLLSFPLVFLIGVAVFVLRPRQRAAQLLFLFGTAYLADDWMTWVFVTQGVADLFSPVTYWPRIALGNLLWTIWILPLFLHLFLVFPVVKWPMRRFPRALPVLLYGSGLLATAGFVMANILGEEASGILFSLVFAVPVSALSVVSLLHSARAVTDAVARSQARWAAFGCLLGMVAPVILWSVMGGLSPVTPFWVDLLFFTLTLALPVSLAIAILRHNLWDIDLIINRTLVYSLLTAVLGLIYFAGVVSIQAVIRSLSGQESQLAHVSSTLAIAGLFHPLRRQIQEFIDRRFYRQRYDAEKTLAAFATTVRDEVEIDQLVASLLDVVHRTTHPAYVSLWLKELNTERT